MKYVYYETKIYDIRGRAVVNNFLDYDTDYYRYLIFDSDRVIVGVLVPVFELVRKTFPLSGFKKVLPSFFNRKLCKYNFDKFIDPRSYDAKISISLMDSIQRFRPLHKFSKGFVGFIRTDVNIVSVNQIDTEIDTAMAYRYCYLIDYEKAIRK